MRFPDHTFGFTPSFPDHQQNSVNPFLSPFYQHCFHPFFPHRTRWHPPRTCLIVSPRFSPHISSQYPEPYVVSTPNPESLCVVELRPCTLRSCHYEESSVLGRGNGMSPFACNRQASKHSKSPAWYQDRATILSLLSPALPPPRRPWIVFVSSFSARKAIWRDLLSS